jgi:AcrR family transcriptional regulator
MEFNEKQLAIIHTAEKLFSVTGFDGTSVRDIANEAGINVAMVSYYFGSKEKLMEAVFEQRTNQMRIKVENMLQNDQYTHLEKFYLIIDEYVDKFINQQEFHKLMMREQFNEKGTLITDMIHEVKLKNLESITKLIKAGQKAGDFAKNIDVVLMMATITGTVSQVINSQRFYRETHNMTDLPTEEFNKHIRKKLSTYLKNIFKTFLINEA